MSIGHVNNAFVSFGSANVGEANTCVASSSFYDCTIWFESVIIIFLRNTLDKWVAKIIQALLFGILDQTESSSILDAASGVLEFGLAIDVRSCHLRQSLQIDLSQG